MPAGDLNEVDGTETYARDFFDRFFPQTALDMLERLPGFSLQEGADLRGFSGGAGNVLIDGERPSIKSGGLDEILSRIPADAVDRIEVTRGALRAGETSGQGLVANVIRRAQVLAGAWSVELERNAAGLVYPRAEASVVAPLGDWKSTTRVNAFWEQFPWKNFDRARFDSMGVLKLFDIEEAPSSLGDAFISTELKRLVGGGTLTLNARTGLSRFSRDTDRSGFIARLPDGDAADRLTRIRLNSEFWLGELSADWTRPIGKDWSLKVLALGSFELNERTTVSSIEEPVGQDVSTSRFQSKREPFEALGRVTVGRLAGALRPELGAELAFNALSSRLALEVEDSSGIRPISLPASDVEVDELRGEVFANLVWGLAPRVTLESGIAGEFSSISVTGDARADNSFVFFKPSLAATFQVSDALQLRAAFRRTVGQLDFNDFAASANAEDDRLLAGNPDLGPEQTNRASFVADFRSSSGFALNLEAFHDWREAALEQVVLPSGVAGIANVGSARVWGLDAQGTLPLSSLLRGGLLEATAQFRDSRIIDPVTNHPRNINGERNPNIAIDFRQDLTSERFAWGVSYQPQVDTVQFFADETITATRGERWSAFVETTRFLGVKINLSARNLGGQSFPRERLLFEPNRSGRFDGTEILDRERGHFVTLTVSDQF